MPATADPARLRLAALPRRPREIDWTADAAARAALAEAVGARTVRKLRLTGTLVPEGRADWRLKGELGATAVQDCVVTLEPVTTRVDVALRRRFLADPPPAPAGEVEMDEDADEAEPMPATLDLADVAAEALALALPDFPRAAGAEIGEASARPPGAAPLEDEERRPFAGLADLKARLEDDE